MKKTLPERKNARKAPRARTMEDARALIDRAHAIDPEIVRGWVGDFERRLELVAKRRDGRR